MRSWTSSSFFFSFCSSSCSGVTSTLSFSASGSQFLSSFFTPASFLLPSACAEYNRAPASRRVAALADVRATLRAENEAEHERNRLNADVVLIAVGRGQEGGSEEVRAVRG